METTRAAIRSGTDVFVFQTSPTSTATVHKRLMMLRRYLFFLLVACLAILVTFGVLQVQWRLRPQSSDLDLKKSAPNVEVAEAYTAAGSVDPNAWKDGREDGIFKEPKIDVTSPYAMGQTKPAGSNYTRTLVVSKLKVEDTRWIEEQLGDMIDSGLLSTAIYTTDDLTAPLHAIRNKGHEVVSYLTYIRDFYNDLPDVVIFMHAHRFAWHNNLLLDKDSSLMVRHLSPERVTRDGYMNLRCHWEPGCPDWLHPGETDYMKDKREQEILADCWAELFPKDPTPSVLAQPCCAQFAVSRERIQAIPKERFVWLLDWILRTDLDDFISGRIFEYIWQYIFTALPLHCPSMSVCYCDGFGLCFGDAEKFDHYFELDYYLQQYKEELREWKFKALDVAYARLHAKEGRLTGQEMLEVPHVGRDDWLREEIERLEGLRNTTKAEAIERGKDPRLRAKEAGRAWKEG